ncbi:hypothetical protein DWF00_27725 [Bosea caraganae]|uniref:Uncharacterized protein n=2 Tax=Bosea caraganae TaxID=2763117 RepID=A0A370L044_9HYPH|nr:hypothetical protein DWE98_25830 [Bosea caraganae]RDJ21166.1 hypothetical protein DWF00_27725 [Bosea caraganae]
MDGDPDTYILSAKCRNYVETGTVVIFSRTPETKARFLERCKQARGHIDHAQTLLEVWLSTVAIAYGQAYGAHRSLLDGISATEKLGHDLLLGFALAFVGGGAGSVVGALVGSTVKEVMKDALGQGFMIDGIKDLAKFSVRGTGADVFRAKSNAKMPTDPFLWKENVRRVVLAEFGLIKGIVNAWEAAVYSDEPIYGDDDEILPDFDPVKEAQDDLRLTVNGVPLAIGALPDIDQDALQKAYEKGFLVGWIKTCGRNATQVPLARESVIGDLRNAGVRLGVTDIDQLLNQYIPGTDWSAWTPPAGM